MTRELKFRAWDKVNKEMIFFQGLFGHVRPSHHVVTMQYIGVKDLCEGDICEDKEGSICVIKWNDKDLASCGCCFDEFQGVGFVAEYKVLGRWHYFCTDLEGLKVVGNIHENPELMEVKDG